MSGDPVRLHLGCGDVHLDGFVNMDSQDSDAVDIVGDMRDLSRYADGSVERIECYHAIEHLSEAEAYQAVKEWCRVLMPGATLIIESPNLRACARGIVETSPWERGWFRYCVWGLFCAQVGKEMDSNGRHLAHGTVHKWLYTPETLAELLEDSGFEDVVMKTPQTHDSSRDMRAEAKKPRALVRDGQSTELQGED